MDIEGEIEMLNSLDNIIHRAELIRETIKAIEEHQDHEIVHLSEIKADAHVIQFIAKKIQKIIDNRVSFEIK